MATGTVHSSNMGLVSSELPIGKYGSENFLIIFDTDLQDDQWAIYNGDRMISGPHPIADEKMADHMRRTFQKLGLTPETKPREEPEEEEAPANPAPKAQAVKPAKPLTPRAPITTPKEVQPVPIEVPKPIDTPDTMTDLETGEVVAITRKMRLDAMDVHDDIKHHDERSSIHLIALGKALKRMRDERLYLALGLPSFAAYCEGFKLNRQVAYDRITAAEEVPQTSESALVVPERQVSYSNRLLLNRAHPDDRKVIEERLDVSDVSKRDLTQALQTAKAERERREESERCFADLEAKYNTLKAQPPAVVEVPVPQRVEVADPASEAQVTEMRKTVTEKNQTIEQLHQKLAQVQKWYDQTNKDLEALRARADKNYDLEERIRVNEQRAKELEQLIQQMQSAFEDGKRNVRGGAELMRTVFPLERISWDIAKRVGDLRKQGVGGPAEDGDLTKLSKVLRQIAADLDAIVKDRKEITINVEVPKNG